MRHICSASEAIREGIKLWPEQCFHKFFEGDKAACATGAMIGAMLGRPLTVEEMLDPVVFNETTRPITKLFRYLNTEVKPPCGCAKLVDGPYNKFAGRPSERLNLCNIAVHLNNHHQWSREQIADWLESEEEKLGFVTLVEKVETVSTPADDKAYYHYARSLGLCGRCKQRDALTDMAYCLECRTAMQRYNHKRKGPPRKVYVTKFTAAVERMMG